jgi:hypothetical protein
MSRSERIGKAGAAAAGAFDHAQQAADRVKPYASGAHAAARRGVRRARAVAAPQLERAGHSLEDGVAPKVSAMLSSAAQRLDPPKPRSRRWRRLAGISLLTAASVVAAVVRNRAKPDLAPPEESDTDSAASARNSYLSADRGRSRWRARNVRNGCRAVAARCGVVPGAISDDQSRL